MEDNIKKFLGYLPYIVPIVYFLGFILINGYLNNYGYSDYSILSITYLKAGILISLLIAVFFLNAWLCFDKETMTDNYQKSWKSLLLIFHNTLFFTCLMFFYLIEIKTFSSPLLFFLIFLFFIYLLFALWADNKSPKNTAGYLILIIPSLIILLIIDLLFAFNITLAKYLLIFNIVVSIFITLSLGVYGDKKYNGRIITDFIFLVVVCFIFGNKIYGLLPYKIGGGEPYRIILNNNSIMNNPTYDSDTLNVIYENEKQFIFLRDSNVLVVARDEIKCYYLIKKKLP